MNNTKNHLVDPVTEKAPVTFDSEQKQIAEDALSVLRKHYWGYKWGIEFSEKDKNNEWAMYIRLLDVPTDVVYVVNYKKIDKDRMRCAMRGGGLLLEALGLPAARATGDNVRGLKKTAAGLIIPAHAAMPENNPGYEAIKKQNELLGN